MKDLSATTHPLFVSADGSCTAYSAQYGEHYHSLKDGALNETLHKHVIPGFALKKEKKELHILDICFGLGLNTLTTLWYYKTHAPDTKLFLYSPELDEELLATLTSFNYPEIFQPFLPILHVVLQEGCYEDKQCRIELFRGDAREYVRTFSDRFDIVYQDAFSPAKNPTLWTVEYFADIYNAMKKDAILTTYSIALPVRLALYRNDFYLYLWHDEKVRSFTVASKKPLLEHTPLDMEHKIRCNPNILPLSDTQIA